ncbi:PAS domain-containing protein [Natronomonas sp. EA1]|uniref:PAS domain-containing protein n=1 Tax=Natronomonas sp. EA1 TaxID=3421655 RepID=UPI003EC0FED8
MDEDPPSSNPAAAWRHQQEAALDAASPVVGLAFTHARNRELLQQVLAEFETVVVSESIPDDIDVMLVDEGGLRTVSDRLVEWKRTERPATAPVMLITEPDPDPWKRHASLFGSHLDAILTTPSSNEKIRARVEGLLESRRYSLIARERQAQLELYERAMDGASIGITIADATDPELPLVFANQGFVDITGYDEEAVLGRNCRFLQGEDTDQETVDEIREALHAHEPVSVTIRNYRKSGEPFWNQLDIMPVVDDDGEVTHFLGFQQDVTTQKYRETLLEQNTQVLDSLRDPVFALDSDGRIIDANEAAEALVPPEAAPVVSHPLAEVLPAGGPAIEAAIDALETVGDQQKLELRFGNDGQSTVFQFYFQLEQLSGDPPERRIIAVGRDISDIRRRNNQLTVLDRILRHNLRNKLNVVIGNAQLISDDVGRLDDETIAHLSENVIDAANELLSIGDSARRFSTPAELGRTSARTVDLATAVDETVAHLRPTAPNATITSSIPNGIIVEAPENIGLCLERIIGNSIEHAESETVAVTITATVSPTRGTVTLRVSDDGPGFPEMERAVLSEGTETQLQHTQGVSLWLVKWAVESVGGALEIENNEQGGSTVSLELPLSEDRPEEV